MFHEAVFPKKATRVFLFFVFCFFFFFFFGGGGILAISNALTG